MEEKDFEIMEDLNTASDEPDSRDWEFEHIFSTADTDVATKKEFPEITMFSQGYTSACTRFWLWLGNNWQNINEYEDAWAKYSEINPIVPWNRFCKKRGYSNKWSSLQSALKQAKDEWVIEWYLVCKTKEQVMAAMDMWYFIYTWSAKWRWSGTRKNGWIYIERKDNKYARHAWSAVAYDDKYVTAINSYWPNRWPLGGKFKVDWDTFLNRCYTKYAIVDKDDSWKLKNYRYLLEVQRAIDNGFFNGENMDKPLTRMQAAAVTTRIIKHCLK